MIGQKIGNLRALNNLSDIQLIASNVSDFEFGGA